jgi:hypothetical protein
MNKIKNQYNEQSLKYKLKTLKYMNEIPKP